jgi:hypothetical protein
MSEFLSQSPFNFLCLRGRFAVVDSERKSLGQHTMESKMYGVNPMKKAQTFDIGQDSFFKILSEKDFLQVIKYPARTRCPQQLLRGQRLSSCWF